MHAPGIMKLAMDLLRCEVQVGQGLHVDVANLFLRPIVAQFRPCGWSFSARLRQGDSPRLILVFACSAWPSRRWLPSRRQGSVAGSAILTHIRGEYRHDNYRLAASLRFVFREPEFGAGEVGWLTIELFLWQDFAHQRSAYLGSSHIFVQCLAPLSRAQWQ